MRPTLSDLTNYINRLPTAEYIVKDGIACAFPEYDIKYNDNEPYQASLDKLDSSSTMMNERLNILYYQLQLNEFCQKISKFIITFYTNKMVVNEEIDITIRKIYHEITDISPKIISNFKDRFNKIIMIFNKILTHYNDIKDNNIKITDDILLDFNNLNKQILSL